MTNKLMTSSLSWKKIRKIQKSRKEISTIKIVVLICIRIGSNSEPLFREQYEIVLYLSKITPVISYSTDDDWQIWNKN